MKLRGLKPAVSWSEILKAAHRSIRALKGAVLWPQMYKSGKRFSIVVVARGRKAYSEANTAMIFITFIPWLLFWGILGAHQSELAAHTASIAALAIFIVNLSRGRKAKVLQIATLFFFIALSVLAVFLDLEHFFSWVRLAAGLLLASVALISILIRKPFILQYTSERLPPEKRGSPDFMRSNYIVSWVWCGVFFAQTIFPLMRVLGFGLSRIWGSAFAILVIFAGLNLSNRYLPLKQFKA